MFEEFLKNDGVSSVSNKQPNNFKFSFNNSIIMIFTATTNLTIIITATTVTNVQMYGISIPTTEATSIGTKSFYSSHVWEQIRLNLKNAFHCVGKTNHLAKNQPNLQGIMHELNALQNNQSIKSRTSKSINSNQKILVKMTRIDWSPIHKFKLVLKIYSPRENFFLIFEKYFRKLRTIFSPTCLIWLSFRRAILVWNLNSSPKILFWTRVWL